MVGYGLPTYERARLADITDILQALLWAFVKANSEGQAPAQPTPVERPWEALLDAAAPPTPSHPRQADATELAAFFGIQPTFTR